MEISESQELSLRKQKRVPWLVKIIYLNPYFPYPEYNFARLFVAIAYIIWGAIIFLPSNHYTFYHTLAVIAPPKAWGCFSIFLGLFSFWRIAEFKKPTIFCSWINLFVASSWWAFCIIIFFARGAVQPGMTGNIIVALLATYIYMFIDVKVKNV